MPELPPGGLKVAVEVTRIASTPDRTDPRAEALQHSVRACPFRPHSFQLALRPRPVLAEHVRNRAAGRQVG